MRKIYLIAEFIFIFVILPILLTYFELYNSFLFFLWGFGLWAFITLKRDKSFDNKLLWNRESLSLENIRPIILRFMILGSMIAILTYFLEKDEFLKFPMEHTYLWLAVMILYPILSVYPQELIYRALQFHRYKFILGENFLALFITSLTFGFVHIIFENWLAVLFTIIGGFLFGYSYKKHNSLALACIEHSLYGCLIFTIGLGKYFFRGHVGV